MAVLREARRPGRFRIAAGTGACEVHAVLLWHEFQRHGNPVGRTGALPGDDDRLVRNAAALMPRLPYPKGVFRFRTHEEADAWTNEHVLRAALLKARTHRDATT